MVIFDDILQRNTPSELEFEHHPYIQQATQYSRMFEKGPFKYHVINILTFLNAIHPPAT